MEEGKETPGDLGTEQGSDDEMKSKIEDMKKQYFECLRCGYVWKPHNQTPKVCPKCKSYNWQTPSKWKQ